MDFTSLINSQSALLAAATGIAGAAGLIIGWGVTRLAGARRLGRQDTRYQSEIATLKETVRSKSDENSTQKSQLETVRQEAMAANARILDLTRDLADARARMASAKSAFEEKIALLSDMKTNLEETVRSLSASALEKNNRVFLDLADAAFSKYLVSAKTDFDAKSNAVKDIVDPVKEALNRFDRQMQSVEREREKAYGGLSQQVVSLSAAQAELQKETGKLVRAMRLPHVRGRWGEITLRRVAELSGMTDRCDFIEQLTTQADSGLLRPDMVVCLPGDRQIVVDAKVPVAAYLDALEAEDEGHREKCLADHARQVQQHIRQLSRKNYWAQFDTSPEFVVLFIPGENFFSAALAADAGLIEFGAKNGVILATPTTLITLLKTISFAWRQESMAQNAKAISRLGTDLYERLNTMAGHVNRLGRDIERSAGTYNQMVGSMEKRVFAAARKFSDLGLVLKDDNALPAADPVDTRTRKLIRTVPEVDENKTEESET